MKKLTAIFLMLTLVFIVSACSNGGNPSPDPNPPGNGAGLEGSLEDILTSIYEAGEFSQPFIDWTLSSLIINEINEDNCEYHLGKAGLEFAEAIISEPEMQPGPYALCLVRVHPGADIEKLKQDIRDNADPAKWVCVGVDPSNIIVDSIGDIVILIMSDIDAQALHSAFLSLGN